MGRAINSPILSAWNVLLICRNSNRSSCQKAALMYKRLGVSASSSFQIRWIIASSVAFSNCSAEIFWSALCRIAFPFIVSSRFKIRKLHHISFFDSTMPSGGLSVRNRCVIRSLPGLTSDLCFSSIVSTGIIVVLTKQPTKEKNSLSTSLSAPKGCSK